MALSILLIKLQYCFSYIVWMFFHCCRSLLFSSATSSCWLRSFSCYSSLSFSSNICSILIRVSYNLSTTSAYFYSNSLFQAFLYSTSCCNYDTTFSCSYFCFCLYYYWQAYSYICSSILWIVSRSLCKFCSYASLFGGLGGFSNRCVRHYFFYEICSPSF